MAPFCIFEETLKKLGQKLEANFVDFSTLSPVLPGVAISRQSGYFGKSVAGKNLWLVATIIVAIFGLRIGLFVAIFDLEIWHEMTLM